MIAKNKYVGLILFLILLLSCTSRKIIPEKDMVSILAKVYITDATVIKSDLRNTFFDKDTIDYYAKIYQKYGYTAAQFDTSFNYYSRDPKKLDAIYDKVIFELSKMETKAMAENVVKIDSVVKDTLKNLWTLKSHWEVPSDGAINPVEFELPVIGEGVYSVSADITVYTDDESVNPSITAYFFFDDKSKNGNISVYTLKDLIKDGKQRNYRIDLKLTSSLVTNLRGFILDHHNSDPKFKKHCSASNIKVTFKPFLENKKVKKQIMHKLKRI